MPSNSRPGLDSHGHHRATALSFSELVPGPRVTDAGSLQMGCVSTETSPPSEAAGPLRTVVPASERDADGCVADAYGGGPEPASADTDAGRPAGTTRS